MKYLLTYSIIYDIKVQTKKYTMFISCTACLAIIACIVQIKGHLVYNKEAGIDPNVTSWTIWGLTSVIDTWNYSEMTGDWQKNILSITCSLSCLGTWVICLFRHKFSKFKLSHFFSISICFIAMFVWKHFGEVKNANLILQVDNLISFMPIIWAAWKYPGSERPRPWIWWTVSYFLGGIVVILRFVQWQDLIYPFGCAVLHFIVALLANRKTALPAV